MTTAEAAALPAVRPYQHYVYAYPHKTAYRPLPRERALLRELWAAEPKNALSLYFHIPFCEVRCGFCNLFTRIGAPDGLTTAYLDALERQAVAVREALGDGARFANAASVAALRPSWRPRNSSGCAIWPSTAWAPTCWPSRCPWRPRPRPRRRTGCPCWPPAAPHG